MAKDKNDMEKAKETKARAKARKEQGNEQEKENQNGTDKSGILPAFRTSASGAEALDTVLRHVRLPRRRRSLGTTFRIKVEHVAGICPETGAAKTNSISTWCSLLKEVSVDCVVGQCLGSGVLAEACRSSGKNCVGFVGHATHL